MLHVLWHWSRMSCCESFVMLRRSLPVSNIWYWHWFMLKISCSCHIYTSTFETWLVIGTYFADGPTQNLTRFCNSNGSGNRFMLKQTHHWVRCDLMIHWSVLRWGQHDQLGIVALLHSTQSTQAGVSAIPSGCWTFPWISCSRLFSLTALKQPGCPTQLLPSVVHAGL